MTFRTSTTTENILAAINADVNKLGITGKVVATGNSDIGNDGTMTFGIEPPAEYGFTEGGFIGYNAGSQFSLYSNENSYIQWDGSKLLIQATNFTLDEGGNITAVNADLSGSITAASGSIGGWGITDNKIYSGADGTFVSMDSGGTNPSFSAGSSVVSTAPFRVYSDGRLYASNANISGSITATSGCFGGWSLATSKLYSTGIDLNSGSNAGLGFGVTPPVSATTGTGIWLDRTGLYGLNANASKFTISATTGSIVATSGSIGGWTLDTNKIYGSGINLISGSGAAISLGITPPTSSSAGTGIWIDKSGLYGLLSNASKFTISATTGSISATSGSIGGNALSDTYIGSPNFVSGVLGSGWRINSNGSAEFENIIARGMIRTSVFQKDTISAVNGLVLVSKADILNVDMTALDASTLTISGSTTFSGSEIVRIKDGTNDEWLRITSASSAPTYAVVRDLAGSYSANNNPVWKKGTAVVSMGSGASGSLTGYVLIDSSSSNSPYIDIYGRNSITYNDTTLHGRFGWLKGITDADVGLNATDIWGVYTDNAYIKGTIVASSGSIGGWKIVSGSIIDLSGTVGLSSRVTAGDDIRIWAGNATPSSAPFYVTESGILKATSASITGNITATSGSIGGWSISNIKISSSGIDLISGSGAGISFGYDGYRPTSPTSGCGIWLDKTGLYGLNNTGQQVAINSDTGKISAIGGNLLIDANGISATLLGEAYSQTADDGSSFRRGGLGMYTLPGNTVPAFGISYRDNSNTTEKITNGSFVSGSASWTFVQAGFSVSGSYLVSSTGSGIISQVVTIDDTKTYTLSSLLKGTVYPEGFSSNYDLGRCIVNLYWYDDVSGSGTLLSSQEPIFNYFGSTWTTLSESIFPPAGSKSLKVSLQAFITRDYGSAVTMYSMFDDISVKEVAGPNTKWILTPQPTAINTGIGATELSGSPTAPTSGLRMIYAKSDGWYDLTSGSVYRLIANGRPDFNFSKPIWSDFYSSTESSGYDEFTGVGFVSGSVVSGVTTEKNHPGIVNISNQASTANSGGYVITSTKAYMIRGGERFVTIFKRGSVATARTARLGFTNSATATSPTLYVMGYISGSTLNGMYANTTTSATTASSYFIAANTWYRFEMDIDSSDITHYVASYRLYNELGALLWSDSIIDIGKSAIEIDGACGAGHVTWSSSSTSVTLSTLDYMAVWNDTEHLIR